MIPFRPFALALCFVVSLALGGCATSQATQYRVSSCEVGCTDAANACTTECITQMGYGSKETCEQNCGRQRQGCVSNCLQR